MCNDSPCFRKSIQNAKLNSLTVNFAAGRSHDQLYKVCNLFALQHLCCRHKILQTSVGTGTDEYLVDGLALTQAVLNIPVTDAYEKAVQLIVEQIHQKKGKLVTSGMGKAGQIAMNIATTFCSTGIPSVFLHPSEAQHGDLGILQKNDLLLLISNSGKTREIVELTRLAHNLDPDLKFIVITGNPDSPLAQESDVCLSTGKPAEVCTLGMTPTTSTTAMTVIGDILVVQTMKTTQFTIEEYSKRHHGGYLGEKSRSLCEK